MKMSDEFVNKYWLKSFNLLQGAPSNWLMKAKELYIAACYLHKISEKAKKEQSRLLNKDNMKEGVRRMTKKEIKLLCERGLESISLMLIGFAFENLAKGILNRSDKEYFSKIIDDHLNIDMIVKSGIRLTNKQKMVVDKLAKYIIWQGRYAVPLKPDGLKPLRGKGHERIYSGDKPVKDQFMIIKNLYIQLVNKLNS